MKLQYTKEVNVEKFEVELKKSTINLAHYAGTTSTMNECIISFDAEITPEEVASLQALVEAHNPSPTFLQIAREKRLEAVDFGTQILEEFIDENISLGITQRGLTNHVRRTMTGVMSALYTGSLYDAIDELVLVDPVALDAYILTPERLLSFRNRIEEYNNLPLSTVWNQARQ